MITIEFNRETQLFTAYYNGTMLAYDADLKRLLSDLRTDADDVEQLIKAEHYAD